MSDHLPTRGVKADLHPQKPPWGTSDFGFRLPSYINLQGDTSPRAARETDLRLQPSCRQGSAEGPPAAGNPCTAEGPRRVPDSASPRLLLQNVPVRRGPRGHRVQPLCFSERKTKQRGLARGSQPGRARAETRTQALTPGSSPSSWVTPKVTLAPSCHLKCGHCGPPQPARSTS